MGGLRQGPCRGPESPIEARPNERNRAVEQPPRQCFRPSRALARQVRTGADRRRRRALRSDRPQPGGVDRRPVRAGCRGAATARWRRPERDGARRGDPPPERAVAVVAPVRPGSLPGAHGVGAGRAAGLHRAARTDRPRWPASASRLALPCRRTVLRWHPRQSDGTDQSSPLSLDRWSDQRLLGRSLHRRRPDQSSRP
jgi:hypothetical protein